MDGRDDIRPGLERWRPPRDAPEREGIIHKLPELIVIYIQNGERGQINGRPSSGRGGPTPPPLAGYFNNEHHFGG